MENEQDKMPETAANTNTALGGTQYSVIFKNNSREGGDVCIYQRDPNSMDQNIMSLAWLSKYTPPTTQTTFSWEENYSFVWSETGWLVPGVIFMASQTWDADLSTRNQVTFSYRQGNHTFVDQHQGPQQGSLFIKEDGTIPRGIASVGIGMSGSGTFARLASPNTQLIFNPHPTYFITFGKYQRGEVLDVDQISNAMQLNFERGVYSLTAVLNMDHTWTVSRT
jgi:rhizosphere induced protein